VTAEAIAFTALDACAGVDSYPLAIPARQQKRLIDSSCQPACRQKKTPPAQA
jgi:hypothetical protein